MGNETVGWIRSLTVILAVFGLAVGLSACQDDGPMERAGEALDEAAEDVADTAEDTTKKVADSTE